MRERVDGQTPARSAGDGPPELVVVCGLPGVGKSRVAREFGARLSAPVFRTDSVRKELVDEPTYGRAETERVYATVRERALSSVPGGGRAVLDGTYRRASFRADVAAGARRVSVDWAFVVVECPAPVVRERIAGRTDDVSDAGLEEYRTIREAFDPLERPHVTVDNSGDWSATRKQVRAAFGGDRQ